jgi:hypothetical protein
MAGKLKGYSNNLSKGSCKLQQNTNKHWRLRLTTYTLTIDEVRAYLLIASKRDYRINISL